MSGPDRRHSNPEAGPSKPRSVQTVKSEPANVELDQLLSGEKDWTRPWTAEPRETDSLITNQYCDISDDPVAGIKGKGKEIITDLPDIQGHCEICVDHQTATGSEFLANPNSSALIEEILRRPEGRYGQDFNKLVDAEGIFGDYSRGKPRTRMLPTPPASQRARSSADTSQSGAAEQLEDIQTQLGLHAQELHEQHRKGGLLVRLRSPHRQADRCMKKLDRALRKLLKALRETIASCLIIDQILELVCRVDEVFGAGKEEEMVEKAQAARKGVKELCHELDERRSGSTRS